MIELICTKGILYNFNSGQTYYMDNNSISNDFGERMTVHKTDTSVIEVWLGEDVATFIPKQLDQEELNLEQMLRVSQIERSQVKFAPITPGHAEFCMCPKCVPLSEKDNQGDRESE